MSNYIKLLIGLLIFTILAGCLAAGSFEALQSKDGREYYCDVRNLTLNTKIVVSRDGETIGEIMGDIVTLLTDPLRMVKDGEVYAWADDNYNVINQDDHAIFVDGAYQFTMIGEFNFFGDSYHIKDEKGNKLGYASFNATNTHGNIYNAKDELVAEYSSNYFLKDYTVMVYTDDFDDTALLLLCASYYSDRDTDHR